MTALLSNPFASSVAGFAVVLMSIIVFIGKRDRSQASGCFYSMFAGMVVVITVALLLGFTG